VKHSALHCISMLITTCQKFTIPEANLRGLVSFLNSEMGDFMMHGASFTVLQKMVERGYHVPELYDIVTAGMIKMLGYNSRAMHSKFTTIFVEFLIHFPMEQKRMNEHLTFVMKNLGHEFESARLALLEACNKMFTRFPVEVVQKYFELFFTPLALRWANEVSANCRKMIAEVMRVLLSACSKEQWQQAVVLTTSWICSREDYLGKKPKVKNSAKLEAAMVSYKQQVAKRGTLMMMGVQVLGVLAQSTTDFVARLAEDIVSSKLMGHIHAEVNRYQQLEETMPEEDTEWHIAYHCLCAIEKIRLYVPGARDMQVMKNLLDPVIALVDHPHVWMKQVSSRILGDFFASFEQGWEESEVSLSEPAQLYTLLEALLRLMKSPLLIDQLAQQTIKNLVFVARCLLDHEKFKCKPTEEGERQVTGIGYIFGNMHLLLVDETNTEVQRMSGMRCMAAIMVQVPTDKEEVGQVLRSLIKSMISITENPDAALKYKTLAQEVLEMAKSHVGNDKYFDAFYEMRSRASASKNKRKELRVVAKLQNPDRQSAKRQRKTVKKTEKKRKARIEADEVNPEDSITLPAWKKKQIFES